MGFHKTYNYHNNEIKTTIMIPLWAFRHSVRIHQEYFQKEQNQPTNGYVKVPLRSICRHFDGTVGSCTYGERCPFYHIVSYGDNNKKEEKICGIKIKKKELQKNITITNTNEEKKGMYNHVDNKIGNEENEIISKANYNGDEDLIEGEIIIFQGLQNDENLHIQDKNILHIAKKENAIEEHKNKNITKKRYELQKKEDNYFSFNITEKKEKEYNNNELYNDLINYDDKFMMEYVNKILKENDDNNYIT